MIYLDWAATSPPELDFLAAGMEAAIRFFGNPSSSHAAGVEARACLENARRRFSETLRTGSGTIAFTGSGSEADSIPLLSLFRNAAKRLGTDGRTAGPPLHLITTSIEHAAVYSQASVLASSGFEVSFIDPGPDGTIDPEAIASALRPETVLVSVMAVNNETGAIQPIRQIASAIRASTRRGGRSPLLHSDAVQALGKINFPPEELGLDCASFSAHKIRGPRGVGAFWYSRRFDPLAVGGGQEGGMRAGTENLPGILAFSLAVEKAASTLAERRDRALALEERIIAGIRRIPSATILPENRKSGDERYSPFIVPIAFPGLSGEVLQRALSDAGIAVSTGSACSSRTRAKTRRILHAMGIPESLAMSSIRVSTGETTGSDEIDHFLETVKTLYQRLRT